MNLPPLPPGSNFFGHRFSTTIPTFSIRIGGHVHIFPLDEPINPPELRTVIAGTAILEWDNARTIQVLESAQELWAEWAIAPDHIPDAGKKEKTK